MPPKPRPVTAKVLQSLLTRIGSASSGTKDVLYTRLGRDLGRHRLFDLRPEWKARQEKEWGRTLRIVSIDMGIKNLAYCDAAVDYPRKGDLSAKMEIIRWDKIDLVSATKGYRSHLPNPRLIKEGSVEADEEVDPYSLQVLSRTAYWLVKQVLLQARPDIILIERQRWRSASSAAIQQWTVRVNTLEAMIWAILNTLRMERSIVIKRLQEHDAKWDYEVFGIDPKRVGQYWLTQHASATAADGDTAVDTELLQELAEKEQGKTTKSKKIPRSKAEKKAKIAVLRSWLVQENPSTAPSTPPADPIISFQMGHLALKAQEALSLPRTRRTKKAVKSKDLAASTDKEEDDSDQITKLDDITDCFLQAAAFVAWESNRKQLLQVWEKTRQDSGILKGLDDDILRDMIKRVDEG